MSKRKTSIALLDMQGIFDRLCNIANIGAGARARLIDGDLIDQEQLYELQEKLSDLMTDVAHAVPGAADTLVERWPHVWRKVKR